MLLIKKQLKEIKEILSKQTVGLHGSKQASIDKNLLIEQLNQLSQQGFTLKGYRNHYLYFDYQKSFKNLEEAGFLYDSTLGFSEYIGFRAGISHPFYPYNIFEDRPFRVLEIPLCIMDTTLFTMGLSYTQAKVMIFKMIDQAELNRSHISILWHNTTFEWIDFPFWGKLYWDIIHYAKKKGGRVCDLEELVCG